ncbi:GNAT family N-acetyltransferase [Streptomyces sp. NPDC059949]|uniref:GNAT family N-acetyltransferase n=1 Tax=Streptomyces sp. NPDC059949 TaxID=3347013 RepID=UPI00365E8673
MLAMRPAMAEDQPRLALMIQARSDWMKDKQLPSWRSWGKHVHELAGNCTRHPSEMWVLTEDDVRILGCTTVLRTAAPWTWSADEAAETAYYLNGTVTDPAVRHRKLGTLIADWAVDHAAREGISRVRRDCSSAALAAYYQQQNFQLIRKVATLGHTTYAFERKAERVPALAGWLITGESSAAISKSLRNTLSGAARSHSAEARRFLSNSLRRPVEAPAIII